MIFYHVSTYLKHDGIFVPRIPTSVHKLGENENIPRVCVGLTLEDCFSAIPSGGSRLDMLMEEQHNLFLIFKIDTEKLGISDEDILSSERLFEEAWVMDAEHTNEHWIMTEFEVPQEDRILIHLHDWNEESCDIIPHDIYQLADAEYDGDYFEAYFAKMEDHVPCMSIIKDIQYVPEYPEEDTSFEVIPGDDEDIFLMQEYLKREYDIEAIVEGDTLSIPVTKGTNLAKFFLYRAEMAMQFI